MEGVVPGEGVAVDGARTVLLVGREEAVRDASCGGVDDRPECSWGVERWVGEEEPGEREVVGGVGDSGGGPVEDDGVRRRSGR